MKLTKIDRESFVLAVMQDVPRVDYEAQAKEAYRLFERSVLPTEVLVLYDNPKLRCYLNFYEYVRTPAGLSDFRGVAREQQMPPALWEKLVDLGNKAQEQEDTRRQLKAQLTAAIDACSTLKQAVERMPELEKYLPKDRSQTGVTQLPVIANLVTDLMRAGWKGAEQ